VGSYTNGARAAGDVRSATNRAVTLVRCQILARPDGAMPPKGASSSLARTHLRCPSVRTVARQGGTGVLARRVVRVRSRVRTREPVTVRHHDLREGVLVHHLVLGDDAVRPQEPRGERVVLVISQGLRRAGRHGSTDEVEHRGGIGSVATAGLHRLVAVEPADPADQLGLRTTPFS
jgi:hypothetical protein